MIKERIFAVLLYRLSMICLTVATVIAQKGETCFCGL